MVVKSDLDVVFLDQLLDGVYGADRFGGNPVKADCLGKLEDLAGFGLLPGQVHDAVIDRLDLGCASLALTFSDGLGRGVLVPGDVRFLLAEFLPGKELDDFDRRPRRSSRWPRTP